MGKRIIKAAVVLGAAAGLLALLFFSVKTKRLQVNRWIVSDKDVVGVDISEYQADVDMEKLQEQGVEFIYMKATEGSGHVDGCFAQNWENARECGIPAGAYHFFSFDSPGEQQAENYINTVGSLDGKMIPAIDVEYYADKKANPPEKEDVVRELRSFIAVLEKEYGVKPLIYCSGEIYDKYLAESFGEYPRWVRSIYYPVTFEAGSDWVVWQYCDTAELEGYNGGERCIDLNVLRRGIGTEDLMIRSGQEKAENTSEMQPDRGVCSPQGRFRIKEDEKEWFTTISLRQ